MNRRDKEEQRQLWICRLADMGDSGMTQEEWCRNNGIAYSTLRYWITKLRSEADAENQPANWLKVDLADNQIATLHMPVNEKSNQSPINIRMGEFTVELQDGCDPQRVIEVLRILKAV